MDLEGGKVEFLWSLKEINARADEYWPIVLDIAQKNNLKRIIRCSQRMGRSEQEELTAAQILYPCMQCADIFFLKPVREHYRKDSNAKDLLKRVKAYRVTK